jgi:hypothetical protein
MIYESIKSGHTSITLWRGYCHGIFVEIEQIFTSTIKMGAVKVGYTDYLLKRAFSWCIPEVIIHRILSCVQALAGHRWMESIESAYFFE